MLIIMVLSLIIMLKIENILSIDWFWYIKRLFYIIIYLEISQWYNCVNININAFYKPYELLFRASFWPNILFNLLPPTRQFFHLRLAGLHRLLKSVKNIKYCITCVYCVKEIIYKQLFINIFLVFLYLPLPLPFRILGRQLWNDIGKNQVGQIVFWNLINAHLLSVLKSST